MGKCIGLIGCGNLGYSLSYYIGKLGFNELYLDDLEKDKSHRLKNKIAEQYPSMYVKEGIPTTGLDVIILALSGPATIDFITNTKNHSYFKSRKFFISLGRPNYDNWTAHEKLNNYLIEHNITLIFGLGLEPGLVEIVMHHLAWIHNENPLTSLSAFCGGVPLQPIPPLNYNLLFGNQLPALNRRALYKVNGELRYCNRFDMSERKFIEGIGIFDVYHDGLSPYFLASPYIQHIPTITQQTARWPGFFDCICVLIDLGLLEETPILEGAFTPRDLTHSILLKNGKLKHNQPDISFIEVIGQRHSGSCTRVSIVSTFDARTNLTGMAQLTSFMAIWAAWQATLQLDSYKSGVILSHEFLFGEKTSELLASLQTTLNCVVKYSSTD